MNKENKKSIAACFGNVYQTSLTKLTNQIIVKDGKNNSSK